MQQRLIQACRSCYSGIHLQTVRKRVANRKLIACTTYSSWASASSDDKKMVHTAAAITTQNLQSPAISVLPAGGVKPSSNKKRMAKCI